MTSPTNFTATHFPGSGLLLRDVTVRPVSSLSQSTSREARTPLRTAKVPGVMDPDPLESEH